MIRSTSPTIHATNARTETSGRRMRPTRRKQALHRRGASAIEAALVTPLLVLILLGSVDIGQYVNMAQTVSNASREGARFASRNGVNNVSDVNKAVISYLSETLPNVPPETIDAAVQVTVCDETTGQVLTGDLQVVPPGSPLSVTVDMDFYAIRWIKGVNYWNGQYKVSKTVVRRE